MKVAGGKITPSFINGLRGLVMDYSCQNIDMEKYHKLLIYKGNFTICRVKDFGRGYIYVL
jgi:hypothetical protein